MNVFLRLAIVMAATLLTTSRVQPAAAIVINETVAGFVNYALPAGATPAITGVVIMCEGAPGGPPPSPLPCVGGTPPATQSDAVWFKPGPAGFVAVQMNSDCDKLIGDGPADAPPCGAGAAWSSITGLFAAPPFVAPFPTLYVTEPVALTPGGPSVYNYTPGPGDPGFVTAAVTYDLTSDCSDCACTENGCSVPEPGGSSTAGPALALTLFVWCRRRAGGTPRPCPVGSDPSKLNYCCRRFRFKGRWAVTALIYPRVPG
jgi:hypothetical protein